MGCLEASSCFSAYVGQWFGYFIAFTVKRYTRLNVSGAHIHLLRRFAIDVVQMKPIQKSAATQKMKLGRRTKGP